MNRLLICAATAGLLLTGCASRPDCLPSGGFQAGLANRSPVPTCHHDEYLEAHRLGQALGDMRRERAELLERYEQLQSAERARLRVLERDIPEMETLARMRGLMDPAPAPDP